MSYEFRFDCWNKFIESSFSKKYDFIDAAGISRASYWRWEQEQTMPWNVVIQVCNMFRQPLSRFIATSDTPRPTSFRAVTVDKWNDILPVSENLYSYICKRKNKHMSMLEVAGQLKVSFDTLKRWLSGNALKPYQMKANDFVTILNTLQINISDLYIQSSNPVKDLFTPLGQTRSGVMRANLPRQIWELQEKITELEERIAALEKSKQI